MRQSRTSCPLLPPFKQQSLTPRTPTVSESGRPNTGEEFPQRHGLNPLLFWILSSSSRIKRRRRVEGGGDHAQAELLAEALICEALDLLI